MLRHLKVLQNLVTKQSEIRTTARTVSRQSGPIFDKQTIRKNLLTSQIGGIYSIVCLSVRERGSGLRLAHDVMDEWCRKGGERGRVRQQQQWR